MSILYSNLLLKILIGAAIVSAVVALNQAHSNITPCVTISNYPDHSVVWQCPRGLNTAYLTNMRPYSVFTTVSTDVQTEAWLTKAGDDETVKTLTVQKKLGVPVVLGPGAFMAVSNGTGLIYIYSKTQFLLTIAWSQDVPLK